MKIKQNLNTFVFILIAVILAAAATLIFQHNTSNTNPQLIAQVLGQDITRADIGLTNGDIFSIESCPPDGCAADNPLSELDLIISRAVAKDFIKKNGLEATKAEIDEFERYMDEFMRRDRAERAERLTKIEQQLKSADLPEEQRKELEEYKELLLKLAKHDKESNKEMWSSKDRQPDEFAIMWIEAWKVNKAIFEKYGGTVAITKFGPDPTGAWTALLRDYEKQGHLKIFDKTLRKKFWEYHNQEPEYIATPEEIDFTPLWQKPILQDTNDAGLKP